MRCQMSVREQLQRFPAFQADDFFLLNRAIDDLSNPTLAIYVTLQIHPSYRLR